MSSQLKELVKLPEWVEYLNLCEGAMMTCFMEIFQLEPAKPESYIRFVELKSKIDSIRDMTYFIERQVVSEPQEIAHVDQSYTMRFANLLKKLWRK